MNPDQAAALTSEYQQAVRAGAPRRRPRLPPMGAAFHRFWAAHTFSNLGDGMMLTVLPLLAASLTTDPVLVAGLAAARFLPFLLFPVIAGVLVDRVDRRRAMIAANLVRVGALGALAVSVATGTATIWALYAAMFAVMSCETVYDGGARTLLPTIVRPAALDRANGRIEGARVVVELFAGAPIAGLLFAVGALLPLVSTAGAYLLGGALLLVAVRGRRTGAEPAAEDRAADAPKAASVRADLVEGVRYVLGARVLRALFVLAGVQSLSNALASAQLVLLVRHVLEVPAHAYGFFVASGAVGAFAGSLLVGPLVTWFGRGPTYVATLVLFGCQWIGLAFAPNAIVGAVFFAFGGLAMAVSNVQVTSMFQLIIPERVMGRVLGVQKTLSWGLMPLGAFLGGFLGRIDLRLPFVIGGAVFALASLAFSWWIKEAVALARSAERTREAAKGHTAVAAPAASADQRTRAGRAADTPGGRGAAAGRFRPGGARRRAGPQESPLRRSGA